MPLGPSSPVRTIVTIDVVRAAARDERLGAADDIMIAVEHRLGLERRGVRARRRLGQAIARHLLHRDHRRQIFLLHLRRAEAVDHPARHVVDRDERAGRRAAIGHGFEDQRRFEPAEADPAALLRDVDRAEAELGGLADRVSGEDVLLVPLGRERVIASAVNLRAISWIWSWSSVRSNCVIAAGALGRLRMSASPLPARRVPPPATLRTAARCGPIPLQHALAEGAEVRPPLEPDHLFGPAGDDEQIGVGERSARRPSGTGPAPSLSSI